MMNSGIYRITNLANGKFYIGRAVNFKNRWRAHKSKLNLNKHDNDLLQNAWNKYGEECFIFEIIEYVEKCDLIEREQHWIDCEKACLKNIGYNLSPSAQGQLGYKHSQASKSKMSKSQKIRSDSLSDEEKEKSKHYGNSFKKGILNSKETRAKMSLASKGKPKSEAHRLAISLAHKGKKKTPEHIAKIWESRKLNGSVKS